jgi:hypothetical protein
VPEERRGWARTCVWRFTDCKNVSSFWDITGRGPVEGFLCGTLLIIDARHVFGEWLSVLNCSVLNFGVAKNFYLNRTLEYITISSCVDVYSR